jgi:hypothetical protein
MALAAVLVGPTLPAAAAPTATFVPITGLSHFGGIAIDDTHSHIFISGNADGTVEVLDDAGALITTLTRLPGAGSMAISGHILYVALHDATAIGRINLNTLVVMRRLKLTVGTAAPLSIAPLDGRIWFSMCDGSGGGLGSMLPDGTNQRAYTSLSLPQDCPFLVPQTAGTISRLWGGSTVSNPPTLWKLRVSGTSVTSVLSKTDGTDCGGAVRSLALTAGQGQLLAACGSPYSATGFGLKNLTKRVAYPTGPYPDGVAASPDGATVAVEANASSADDVFLFPMSVTTATASFDFGDSSITPFDDSIRYVAGGTKLVAVGGTTPFGAPTSLMIVALS